MRDNGVDQNYGDILTEELHEIRYFSRKLGVAQERTREIIREYGLNRPVCDPVRNRGYGPQYPAR